jgi:2-oxoglutarate ferredoxin oxidoreductase subunit gamma
MPANATEVLMAGFGGQGMLLSGKLLAHAAMERGLEVSWLPSYGPEMRGGTANVTVCISDKPVGSPYIGSPRALLVMNQPSLEKFGPRVKPGGLIVVNTSLVPIPCDRTDCTVINVPAADLAKQAGTARAANLVMLGVYVGWSGIVDVEATVAAIEAEFAGKAKFIPANVAAFKAGYEEGRKAKGAKA